MEEDENIYTEDCCEQAVQPSICVPDFPETWTPSTINFGGYREDNYPWERSTNNGSIYLVNERFLLKHYDAAGFRVTASQEVELLVRNEETDRLRWVNLTTLQAVPKTK